MPGDETGPPSPSSSLAESRYRVPSLTRIATSGRLKVLVVGVVVLPDDEKASTLPNDAPSPVKKGISNQALAVVRVGSVNQSVDGNLSSVNVVREILDPLVDSADQAQRHRGH